MQVSVSYPDGAHLGDRPLSAETRDERGELLLLESGEIAKERPAGDQAPPVGTGRGQVEQVVQVL